MDGEDTLSSCCASSAKPKSRVAVCLGVGVSEREENDACFLSMGLVLLLLPPPPPAAFDVVDDDVPPTRLLYCMPTITTSSPSSTRSYVKEEKYDYGGWWVSTICNRHIMHMFCVYMYHDIAYQFSSCAIVQMTGIINGDHKET